jgi:ribosomal protein L29
MKRPSSTSKYNTSVSTQELIKELNHAEKLLSDLRFKKATRQPFKSNELKINKKKIATLKNILRDKV